MEDAAEFNAPPEPYIMIPSSTFYNLIIKAFWAKMKRQPTTFRYVIHPFTLEGMHILRACFLYEGVVDAFPTPQMTRGQRGGRYKSWEMRVKETHSFRQAVGRGKFAAVGVESINVFGSMQLLTDHSCVAWAPPLVFTLTAEDQSGEHGTLTITCASVRMTEYGTTFSKSKLHRAQAVQDTCMTYLAVSIFELQQRRTAM